MRSNLSNNDDENKRSKKKKTDITIHKFISKIVIYNEQGIIILENNIATLTKQSTGGIDEKRTLKRSHIKESQNIFEDMIDERKNNLSYS